MSDNNNNRVVLENVNWREVFPFTHLFRTFRLAIHPSKLGFALLAVLICFVGGKMLDWFSPSRVVVEKPSYSLRLPADEIQKYLTSTTMVDFKAWRREALTRNDKKLEAAVVEFLNTKNEKAQEMVQKGEAIDELASSLKVKQKNALEILNARYKVTREIIKGNYKKERGKAEDKLKKVIDRKYDDKLDEVEKARDFLKMSILKSSRVANLVLTLTPQQASRTCFISNPDAKDSTKELREIRKGREQVLDTIKMANTYDSIRNLRGVGVFQASLSYGILMFNSAVESVLSMELFKNANFESFDTTPNVPPGLVKTLGLTLEGFGWFVRVHYIYFIIYTLFCLLVWSIAGGAICRIAALHATRDEKIPLKEAFTFARTKFSGFFVAPLMPIVFIIGCCLVLLGCGLIGSIPFFGEIVVGLTFILMLAVGFVLALIIVGGIGGIGLMYPTIAIEGSDAFDAFSRCYSYVYARPWKTILFTLAAAIYGTLCFIFVKLFIGLVFYATSSIAGATMNLDTSSYAAPLGKLQAMWFSPSFSGPFFGKFYLFPLSVSESLGSFLISIWVFLLVGLVIAFAISFFFCGYTLIYLLLRQAVDTTEMDEVFVEEFETKLPEPEVKSEPEPEPEPETETEAEAEETNDDQTDG